MTRSTRTAGRTAATAGAAIVTALALAACGAASAGGSTPVASAPQPSGTQSGANTPGATATPPVPVATESNPPGDIPDNQAFVAYVSTTGGFTVKVPEGWARTTNGTTVVFTDKLNSVRVEESTSASAPTVASATSADVAALKAAHPAVQLKAVTTFTRPGGTGVLITYLTDSAPDPVTNKVVRDAVERYLFWKSGRLVVVSLVGPVNADNVDPWRKVTDSFKWTR